MSETEGGSRRHPSVYIYIYIYVCVLIYIYIYMYESHLSQTLIILYIIVLLTYETQRLTLGSVGMIIYIWVYIHS
jgi:hypothetical protein